MLLLMATALALGMLHTVAPDHLAAVGVFVSRRPDWRDAARHGARWGIGHSLSILLVGGVAVVSAVRIPPALEPRLEQAVGLMLVGLGVLAWRRAAQGHPPAHAADSPSHAHDEGTLLGIGMVHGLAGSGALVAALPAATARSHAEAFVYLAAFGVGTVVAMAVLAVGLGALIRSAADRALRVQRIVVRAAALTSMLVGGWWFAAS
ncbi:MAG: sulfite exporter TauE/SafE family protein [Gemmatimonadaceae bacterium]|jgi:high-affinity nickel-transport protein|nr:sulfite exporter TauE/SafE family protein [Gemmatimonadaceae bacterium]MCU0625792.1 sulfite exporter TauE/SafE family protein [Gemmatimonadaceae bacterium]